MIKALGIDPGLANLGLSAVVLDAGQVTSLGVRYHKTEKEKAAAFTRQRSSADDQRRIRSMWQSVTAAIQTIQPHVIGIENYNVREPDAIRKLRDFAAHAADSIEKGAALEELHHAAKQLRAILPDAARGGPGLANAAKTMSVYGAALGAAFAAEVPVFVFEPSDRTQRMVGRRSASKEEVGAAVMSRVAGLREKIAEAVPQKTYQEHVFDASCYALMAAEEYHRWKLDV